MPIGTSRKTTCCTDSPSASTSNGHKGVSFFCHRCGYKDFEFHTERSATEILATRQAVEKLASRPPKMPTDAVPVSQGPQQAWQWVLKGGLTPEDATDKHGMMWHEPTRRVLIPIYHNAVLVSLVGRAVFGESPKYRVVSGSADSFYRATTPHSTCTVVVEDVLSAIAVNRAGVNAVAVLGTAITPQHAQQIAAGSTHVVGWFDPDKAGQKAWLRLRSRMQLYPVRLTQIKSTHDPKNLHRQQLKEMLTQGA